MEYVQKDIQRPFRINWNKVFGLIAMHMSLLKYTLSGTVIKDKNKRNLISSIIYSIKNLAGPILTNAGICVFSYLSGYAWLYFLWIGAHLTTYNLSH